jgi:hypothetical protein
MKAAIGIRTWHLILLIMTFSGPLFADSTGVLYPSWGTTVNGNAVYFSVQLKEGYQVQTTSEMSWIVYGGAELNMSPNTTVVIGDPLVLTCGTVTVRFGSIDINDGKSTTSYPIGQPVHSASTSCGSALPDAPSVAQNKQRLHFWSGSQGLTNSGGVPAAATGGVFNENEKVETWSFWAVNGVMFGSSLMAVELTHSCLEAGACTFVPDTFHSRIRTAEVGVPVLAGISYLTYRLKEKNYRWWYIPAALVTSGDVVVSVHAARYSR